MIDMFTKLKNEASKHWSINKWMQGEIYAMYIQESKLEEINCKLTLWVLNQSNPSSILGQLLTIAIQ
jgi:hypothetical protein